MNKEPKMLNVGDKITEHGNYGIRGILTVTRVTATQAVCLISHGREIKFKRIVSGNSISKIGEERWATTWFELTKPADYAAIERKKGLSFLQEYKFSKLPNSQLAQVLDLLKTFENETKPTN